LLERSFLIPLASAGFGVLLFSSALSAQPAPDKIALIEELLEVSHAQDQMQENLNLILAQIGEDYILDIAARGAVAASEGVAPEMQNAIYTEQLTRWDKFVSLVEHKAQIEELTRDVALPVYDKNFTRSELKAIIGFYKNPKTEEKFYDSRAGRKFERMEDQLNSGIKAQIQKRLEPVIQKCLDEVFPKEE
jgi:hypothetical protein